MAEKKKDERKQCELCAEAIPLETEKCPYCPAIYTVTIRGYCKNCHSLSAADASGRCHKCGGEVADLQISSVFKGEEASAAPVAAAPIVEPVAVPLATATTPKSVAAAAAKQPSHKLTGKTWALIITGIVLVVLAAVGVTLWLLSGRGPYAKYHRWHVVFADTFDGNSNHWTLGNWEDDWGRGTMEIDDGALRLGTWASGDASTYEKIPYYVSVSDFYLSMDFKQEGGQISEECPSSIGVAYGYLPDFSSYYSFELCANKDAYLGYVGNGEYQTIAGPSTVASYQLGQFNRLVVVSEDNTVQVYVNDELVLTKTDDRIPPGKLALIGWLQNYNDYAEYYFDNIEIRTP